MEFSVEIRETWLKRKIFDTETRTEAIAAAKAWYASHGNGEKGICDDEDAERVEVDVKLQWPDGRPLPYSG